MKHPTWADNRADLRVDRESEDTPYEYSSQPLTQDVVEEILIQLADDTYHRITDWSQKVHLSLCLPSFTVITTFP